MENVLFIKKLKFSFLKKCTLCLILALVWAEPIVSLCRETQEQWGLTLQQTWTKLILASGVCEFRTRGSFKRLTGGSFSRANWSIILLNKCKCMTFISRPFPAQFLAFELKKIIVFLYCSRFCVIFSVIYGLILFALIKKTNTFTLVPFSA